MITTHNITTYCRGIYGCTASIKTSRESALLTVRDPYGQIVHRKRQKTSHGARIAMGKMSDGWDFVKQEGKTRIKL